MISVIVPVYNIEKYVAACVTSLLSQSYKDFEIILVDDGSTDKSGCICDRLSLKDSKITVIHKQNGGLSSARNAGLEAANGNYVMFLDGDDRLAENALEKLSDILDKENNPDIIQFKYREVGSEGQPLHHIEFTNTYDIVFEEKEKYNRLYALGGVAASSCTKLISKKLFNNLRFKEGIIHEDEFIVTDLLSRSNSVVYLDSPLYLYYFRENSIITSGFSDKRLDFFKIIDRRIEVLKSKEFNDLIKKEYDRLFTIIPFWYPKAKLARNKKAADFMKNKFLQIPDFYGDNLKGKPKFIFFTIKKLPFALDVIYIIKRVLNKI